MTTQKLNLTADWIPDAWVIERLRRREREEQDRRQRPFLEMPQRAPEPEPERQEAPLGGTVIIIEI